MERYSFSKFFKSDSIRNFQLPTNEDDPVNYSNNSKVESNCHYSYLQLFNTDSIRNFQIPTDEDDPDNHTNNSSVECIGNKGFEAIIEHESGNNTESPLNLPSQVTLKRKRSKDEAKAGYEASACHDANDDFEISEEYYRTMLENHARRHFHKRARLEEVASPRSLPVGDVAHDLRINSNLDVAVEDVPDKFLLSTPGLHCATNKPIQNPAIYDELTPSQNFECFPNAQTNMYSCSNPQADGSSLETSPAQQDTLAKRWLFMSETGTLQPCYVQVLEKADDYEVIEHKVLKSLSIQEYPDIVMEDTKKIREYWANIVKRDLPKHQDAFLTYHKKKSCDAKKVADCCQKEVKLRSIRSLKVAKGKIACTRKLAKDMLLFWKLVDKEQAEMRKKEDRDAAEALKREEELREAKRQQQRLNFLLSQTELYSHFMQNKTSSQPIAGASIVEEDVAQKSYDATLTNDKDIEEADLKEKALRVAQNAASEQKKIITAFDNECLKFQDMGANALSQEGIAEGSHNMDLLNPSSMPQTSSVQTPKLFKGILKEYQLKGLQWLVNCYEYGLNGILADEMGLGKTIQAIALLAHLAEVKNIWGPFLVVAPASVLNNWADEISKFCPELKIIPYWGGLQERTILRKKINPKQLYRREASCHILITSYQLVLADEKYLKRVKWQYMILDEAQAIKSAYSLRWKKLLSFNCRNRLLLTGTPIQNNMAELWALLHFIMPALFDSHDQFDEWFSKGIENHAEHGGALNEHQLNRLHAILKPFMLRRVKKDVITEMTNKKEVTVNCTLSSRQQAFYRAIKNKISVAELFDSIQGHPSKNKVCNLINIVMQLRKVCNHPNLFERNEGRTFLHFAQIPNSLLPPPFGELEEIHYAGSQNLISYKVPKLIYREGTQSLPMSCSGSAQGFKQKWLDNLLNIFSTQNVHKSVFPPQSDSHGSVLPVKSGTFGFSRMIGLSPVEVAFFAKASYMEKLLFSCMVQDQQILNEIIEDFLESEEDIFHYDQMEEGKVRAVTRMLMLPTRAKLSLLKSKHPTGPENAPYEELVVSHHDRFLNNVALLKAIYSFIPPVHAPPIDVICPDRGFAYQRAEELHHPWIKKLLVGFSRTSQFNGPAIPQDPQHLIQEIDSELLNQKPVLDLTNRIFGSSPPFKRFDVARLLMDSGKLQTLDALLKQLFAQNHRVLLFAQMTKMLDILEDYINYRKYKYLRLDGSSAVTDRHDMVRAFQNRQDIFIFLLSTRAGGVGINLTAADTVIFYESDWNPTMDLQAMDRAHRLGQTKEVTVYRLICKDTVEEKILQRASKKITVQQLVMAGGHAHSEVLAPGDVVSLLLDDSELEKKIKERFSIQGKERQLKSKRTVVRFDAEGNASLEDSNLLSRETEIEESRKGKGKAKKEQENT